LGIQLLKSFQIQGAPEPLTRGSAPGTRCMELGPRPPVHGFASVEIKSWLRPCLLLLISLNNRTKINTMYQLSQKTKWPHIVYVYMQLILKCYSRRVWSFMFVFSMTMSSARPHTVLSVEFERLCAETLHDRMNACRPSTQSCQCMSKCVPFGGRKQTCQRTVRTIIGICNAAGHECCLNSRQHNRQAEIYSVVCTYKFIDISYMGPVVA